MKQLRCKFKKKKITHENRICPFIFFRYERTTAVHNFLKNSTLVKQAFRFETPQWINKINLLARKKDPRPPAEVRLEPGKREQYGLVGYKIYTDNITIPFLLSR